VQRQDQKIPVPSVAEFCPLLKTLLSFLVFPLCPRHPHWPNHDTAGSAAATGNWIERR